MSAQMSAGGKKSGSSSNSSMVNTPASTPVTTIAQNGAQTSPPPNNAPKYGTLVPNRIFVGGISATTTETELLQLFSNYGTVKAAKIIQDRAGVSKGYGFITFESEDDAKRLQREADNIMLRERKLNIAPAIKKQPFSRGFDGASPPTVAPGYPPNFFPPGSMPFFQGGVAYYPQPQTGPADPGSQQPAVYQTPSVYPPQSAPQQAAPYQPVMFPPQPIYMPQQYPMQMPYEYNYYSNGGPPYMVGGANSGGGAQQSAVAGVAAQMPQMQHQQQQLQQLQQLQQCSNSPPRAHCYGQPGGGYAGAQDGSGMYYNVPMYQMDSGMYTDAGVVDGMPPNGGGISEELHPQHHQHQQQHEHSEPANGVIVIQQNSRQTPSTPTLNSQSSATTFSTALSTSNNNNNNNNGADANRQTATPVVSLLSLDHQQEKDLMSMRGGRRRKPPPATPPSTHSHHNHHSHVPQTTATHTQMIPYMPNMPPPNGYASYPVAYEYYAQAQVTYPHNQTNSNTTNGYESRTWHNKNYKQRNQAWNWKVSNTKISVNTHRRSFDSSLSSPRTDSNSSASVVADDDRRSRAYLPHYNHSHQSHQQQHQHPNSHHRFNNYYPHSHSHSHYRGNYHGGNMNMNGQSGQLVNNLNSVSGGNCGGSGKPTLSMQTTSVTLTDFGSQMQNAPQHFVSPARQPRNNYNNNRRCMRRNGSAGEIGAGDAPLSESSPDGINEACNKLDGLAL